VIVVGVLTFRTVDEIPDPEDRDAAAELWAEFERVRHLAAPVAERLAELRRTAGRPVRIVFGDPAGLEAALDG
jgi:hypothetical protein